jgi:RimJ/RimL family protein N-acetyltransferase
VIGAFPADVRLIGLGLVLREWDDDDLPAMVELFDEPEVGRWTPLASPFDATAARVYLARARAARDAGQRLQLAVTTDGRAPRGEVLIGRGDVAGRAELGYAVGAAHRRQGLARRAVVLATAWAAEVLGVTEVVLRIATDNAASMAVARSAGFVLTDDPPLPRDGTTDEFLTWRHVHGPGPG